MSYKLLIQQLLSFVLYVLAQVTLLKNLVVFDAAFCFVYIGFILFLPLETGRTVLLLIGFLTGFIVDLFYDSIGIHAASGVLIAFLRPIWINILTPQGGYEAGASPYLRETSTTWYISYSLLIIFIHHFAIFFIEAGGFSLFLFTLVKVLSSVTFTFLVLLLVQLLFYRR